MHRRVRPPVRFFFNDTATTEIYTLSLHDALPIRQDPERDDLLYAGTEHGVYVSFNNGDSWQSLRLNLPDTRVYDLKVKGDDVVISTHGRGFYVLDDGAAVLRQLTPKTKA